MVDPQTHRSDPPGRPPTDNLALRAMLFARLAHADQARRYTGDLYVSHLAEVAGIVASVFGVADGAQEAIATAWLHDVVEDQGVTEAVLVEDFGPVVASGVILLSDVEKGNRATRKALACRRLGASPGWVQTIKVADLISNAASIDRHDPQFAGVFAREGRDLLDAMGEADPRLVMIARALLAPPVRRPARA